MFRFEKHGVLRAHFSSEIKDKKMQKVVKKMTKVVDEACINFTTGKKDKALKTINKWVEKDYKKAIDTLYKKNNIMNI